LCCGWPKNASYWSVLGSRFFDVQRSRKAAQLIAWEELRDIKAADQWTIKRQRWLAADPWQGYWRCRQGLTAAMRQAIGLK